MNNNNYGLFGRSYLPKTLLDSSLIAQTNTIKYNMKLIKCNGFIQVYEYPNIRIKKDKNKEEIKKYENFKRINYLPTQKNKTESKNECKPIRPDNALRSKLALERLIKTNIECFKSFLTLTFAKNIENVCEANKEFNIWRTRIKRESSNFMYVCVPEFQKRGAVHYHLLTNLVINSKFITLQKGKRNKYDVLYWNEGFSSVFPIENINVVSYLSKYITKDMNDRLYSHKRYLYSKNLILPTQEYLNSNENKVTSYIQNILQDRTLKFSNEYLNKYTDEKIIFKEYVKNL